MERSQGRDHSIINHGRSNRSPWHWFLFCRSFMQEAIFLNNFFGHPCFSGCSSPARIYYSYWYTQFFIQLSCKEIPYCAEGSHFIRGTDCPFSSQVFLGIA